MQRVRILFAIPFLILFLPMWRFLDMIAFTWPSSTFFGIGLGLIMLILLALPIKFIVSKIHWGYILGVPFVLGLISTQVETNSHMATENPDFNHCGVMTYTGVLYPIRGILSAAHQDDLEIRNQLCWMRKMVSRVLPKFSSDIEFETYTKLVREKLLKPERKYKVTLPLIGVLYGTILNRWENYNIPLMRNIQTGKLFVEMMGFWNDQYTEEITAREYGWWDWTHGNYIKWEYGIIEENLQNLHVEFSN